MRMSGTAYQLYSCLSGTTYTADSAGIIASVAVGDITEMLNMGCSQADTVGSGGITSTATNFALTGRAGASGAGGTVTEVGGAGDVGAAGGAAAASGGAGGAGSTTTAGGAGGAASVSGGAGAAKTDTGHAAGGAGGAANVVAGVGGATASNGTDAGGAGGSVAVTAGAGGAASAGTGAGGAGGNVVRTAGAGGTSAGGAAGIAGVIYDRSPVSRKLSRATITDTATITVAQVLGGVLYQDASGGNVTMTMPTGTVLEAVLGGVATGDSLDLWLSSNHTSNTSTIAGATDMTLVGSGAVTKTGGQFKIIRTGAHAYDLVRVG